jgi:tRNA(fMet)-specific endonuclease VapC
MTRWILDTDHVSLLLEGNDRIYQQTQREGRLVSTSIVTVQEVFNGWVSRINARASLQNPVPLYTKLWSAVEYFKGVPIGNYDEAAHQVYQQLLRDHPPLRKNQLQKDMRIAAIALSLDATVVTRNRKDFGLVPGLSIVDWTIDP